MNTLRISSLVALLTVVACGGGDPERPDNTPDAGSARMPIDAFEGCGRATLEEDLPRAPLSGRAVHDGALAPGHYLVATTYLQLNPDKRARLNELVGPVVTDLVQRDGMLAMALGTSTACNSARTLTVWRDEAAMFDFVTSDAHAHAMQATSELSRGGSLGTHWSGDETAASWEAAAEHLAAEDRAGF